MSKKTRRKLAFQQRGQAILLDSGKELALEHLPSERDLQIVFEKKLCLRLVLQTGETVYAKVLRISFTAGDAYLNGEIINEGGKSGIDFQAVFYYSEEKGWIKL